MTTPEGDLFASHSKEEIEKRKEKIEKRKEEIEKRVEQLVKEDKKLKNESELIYHKGYYKRRKKKPTPKDGQTLPTNYTGRAGECAVISELLFRGYNANHMMVRSWH